jgi:transcriptional regulator with XRE-family HTH domain
MSGPLAENLLRLMAVKGLSLRRLAEQSSLDQRTIRKLLRGTSRPHMDTIRRLAVGLDVPVEDLFLDPTTLASHRFARQTNPLVEEVVREMPEQFSGWTAADFAELYSRFGTGGALTRQGVLQAAAQMNRAREIYKKMAVLLESSRAELIAKIVELLYQEIVPRPAERWGRERGASG